MDSLHSILPRVLRKRGLHQQASASLVTFAAQKWIHSALPHIADALRVSTFSHASLSIMCKHSIAAQECQPLLPALKEYLAKECRPMLVEEIRLVRER